MLPDQSLISLNSVLLQHRLIFSSKWVKKAGLYKAGLIIEKVLLIDLRPRPIYPDSCNNIFLSIYESQLIKSNLKRES
jgi:hypothetical protein